MTKHIWKSVSNVSLTPQNAIEVEELSSVSLEAPVAIADSVRVYIEFETGDKETISLEEQISRVSKELLVEESFNVRRIDDTGYAITADISLTDLPVIEHLSFVSSVKKMDEASLTNELKKNHEKETQESLTSVSEADETYLSESESIDNETIVEEKPESEELISQEECETQSISDIFSTEYVTETTQIQTLEKNDDSKTTSNVATIGIIGIILIILGVLLTRHNKK